VILLDSTLGIMIGILHFNDKTNRALGRRWAMACGCEEWYEVLVAKKRITPTSVVHVILQAC
jgi:hypothetical protein